MDCGPKIGIIPTRETLDELGTIYAEENLAFLRKTLNIPPDAIKDYLIIPKLKTKSVENNNKNIKYSLETNANVNPSNYTVLLKSAPKKGFIDVPHSSSNSDIVSILGSNLAKISKVSEINVIDSQIKIGEVAKPKRIFDQPVSTDSSASAQNKYVSVPVVEIEPFIRSSQKIQVSSSLGEVKGNRLESSQECLENMMQNTSVLRNYINKIKADPHQLVEKPKLFLFGSEVFDVPNKNCSTTAKVFCTDFTKNFKRTPEIKFQYY